MNLAMSSILAVAMATASQAGEAVSYSVAGTAYEGHFARAAPARGTVVILPTWNGISAYEKDRAGMLAELGYNAFVGDLHGRGKLPRSKEEKVAALEALFADADGLRATLRGIVELAEDLGTDDVVVLGYSMGGGAAMELARSGLGKELGVDGYAIFSGRVSDPAGRMIPDGTAPIFVAHGGKDRRVPVSQLVNFEDDLSFTDVDYRIEIYPDAGHLFSAFGFPNYSAEADHESWAAFREFLSKTLPADPAG